MFRSIVLLVSYLASQFITSVQGGELGLTFDQGNFSGNISGAGGLTKVSTGTLVLSGANTYTGPTRIEAGVLVLDGTLSCNVVDVASGATLTNNTGGLSATTSLTNAGTVVCNANNTIAELINSGSISNATYTLSAATYALNGGSIISANLGSGTVTTNGDVVLNGSVSAGTVRVQTDTTTLGSAGRLSEMSNVTVEALATLKLGGDEIIGTLAGAGSIQNAGGSITLDGGNFSGGISGSGGLTKETSSNLILSGANTYTGPTFVNNGSLEVAGTLSGSSISTASGSTLRVSVGSSINVENLMISGILTVANSTSLSYINLSGNGTINSPVFVNRAGATVKGGLTFSGNFSDQGTFAPGNSPGLTSIVGSYTEAGTLHAELQTTTPITGHDQVRVGGSVTLLPSSSLIVETYNNVLPVRGSIYQIIASPSGGVKAVTGIFSALRFDADGASGLGAPVSNAAVLFDQATGRAIATGLNAPNSTFADLGSTANQRQVANIIFINATSLIGPNQINSSTSAGALALQLITSPGGTSNSLANVTPELYGSIAEYALGSDLEVTNLLHDRITNLSNIAGPAPDGFSLYSGMNQHNFDAAEHVIIDRTDTYVGGDYAAMSRFLLGALVTYNNGDFSNSSGRGSLSGLGTDAYFKTHLSPAVNLIGRLGYGSYNCDLRRNTTDTVQASGSTNSNVLTGSLGLNCLGGQWQELSLVPRADLTYSHATVNGFTESGANDRLELGSYEAERLCAQIGASLVWSTHLEGHFLGVEINSGIEHWLMNHKTSQQATMVSTPSVNFSQSFEAAALTSLSYGLRVAYGITSNTSIYAGYEGRVSGDSSDSTSLGLRVSF